MENNTPPISKAKAFLRIVIVSLMCTVALFGIYSLVLPMEFLGESKNFVTAAALIIPLTFYMLIGGPHFLQIELNEYQVIKITTQEIGIEHAITDKISFSVQKRIFNIRTYKFGWETCDIDLKEEEAKTIVDNKFIELKAPVTEVIYKKP